MSPWDMLSKRMLWQQLSGMEGMRVLDFGSGEGITASHLAAKNEVVAVEPDAAAIEKRLRENPYTQVLGGLREIAAMEAESFDAIVCHNVLEYVDARGPVFRAFERLLRPGGTLSLVKHNRNGRIMQMVVLLDDFAHANALLDGLDGHSQQYGPIRYYADDDILRHTSSLVLVQTYGVRTFWHLQQNQGLHGDAAWQERMLDVEMRVSHMPEYQAIAFFHHLLFRKMPFRGA